MSPAEANIWEGGGGGGGERRGWDEMREEDREEGRTQWCVEKECNEMQIGVPMQPPCVEGMRGVWTVMKSTMGHSCSNSMNSMPNLAANVAGIRGSYPTVCRPTKSDQQKKRKEKKCQSHCPRVTITQ